ncbi:hypothetical protein V1477_002712 [Vespula maculifrons]|uniref:Uncharacterized protein n=1 Tax=Vespula maculifrons TaxID=7453 RepID=A0ABD2CVK9_VESMC
MKSSVCLSNETRLTSKSDHARKVQYLKVVDMHLFQIHSNSIVILWMLNKDILEVFLRQNIGLNVL